MKMGWVGGGVQFRFRYVKSGLGPLDKSKMGRKGRVKR